MRLLLVTTEADPFRHRPLFLSEDPTCSLARALRDLDHDVEIITPLYASALHKDGSVQDNSQRAMQKKEKNLSYPYQGSEYELSLIRTRVSGDFDILFLEHQALWPTESTVETMAQTSSEATEATKHFSCAVTAYVEKNQADIDALIFFGWVGATCLIKLHEFGKVDAGLIKIWVQPAEPKKGVFAEGIQKEWETGAQTSNPIADCVMRTNENVDGTSNDVPFLPLGIDSSLWNPATDPCLPSRFDPYDRTGKKQCKSNLQKELNFEVDEQTPLLVGFTPCALSEQLAWLVEAFTQTLQNKVQMVWMMDPRVRQDEVLQKIIVEHPHNFHIHFGQNADWVHQMLAASDMTAVLDSFFGVPASLLAWAQRYGSVPIAMDSHTSNFRIETCDETLSGGSGFLWDTDHKSPKNGSLQHHAQAFSQSVNQALLGFEKPEWDKLVFRCMDQDFGWAKSAYAMHYLLKKLSDNPQKI